MSGTPERFRHGVPTDAGLRRIRRRLLSLVGVVLPAVAVLSVVSRGDPIVLLVAGFTLTLGSGLTLGDASPGRLAKREVLTAGSRRRRRRLRWAVLRGRTGLPDDDLRVCHYLVPVVRARSRLLLLVNATSLLGAALIVSSFWTDIRATGWFLVLVPALLVVALSELALRAVEARAADRFLARREPWAGAAEPAG